MIRVLSGRVLVLEPAFDLELARSVLEPTGASVELATDARGDDVVALLVGPDQPVGRPEIDRLPALRAVATCSVGFDHVDVAAAEERGVVVANVPDYCVEEMADSTLALLLSLLRGVVLLDRSVRDGVWDDHAAGPLARLAGTRLGIVGFGRIGRAVAERTLALGMEVWAHDPIVPDEAIATAGARPSSLDNLLAACGAVTLHCPLNAQTEGLLGRRELGLMPDGAILVNTARAGLVDVEAVDDALVAGRLAAAAFDVWTTEPPDELPAWPNLVLTPHAAWFSPEAEAAAYRRPVEAIRDVLEGRETRDRVTPQ